MTTRTILSITHSTTSRRRIFKRFLCVVFDTKPGCIPDHQVRRYEKPNRYVVITTGVSYHMKQLTTGVLLEIIGTSTNYQCFLVFEVIHTTNYNCYRLPLKIFLFIYYFHNWCHSYTLLQKNWSKITVIVNVWG